MVDNKLKEDIFFIYICLKMRLLCSILMLFELVLCDVVAGIIVTIYLRISRFLYLNHYSKNIICIS